MYSIIKSRWIYREYSAGLLFFLSIKVTAGNKTAAKMQLKKCASVSKTDRSLIYRASSSRLSWSRPFISCSVLWPTLFV